MNDRSVSVLGIAVFTVLALVEPRVGLEFLLPITIVAIIAMIAVFFIDKSGRDEPGKREHPTTNR